MVLTAGGAGWDQGLDVILEGDAARVTDTGLLERLAAAWARKWDGRWGLEVHDGRFRDPDLGGEGSIVFGVRPARVFAHAKGDPFGATTHRF